MSDQHSKHRLGCYGDPVVRTPNLDRLASEGMRFDAAYCPSPICCPSRMSFMTTRFPGKNRVWNNSGILASDIPTWIHPLNNHPFFKIPCRTCLAGRMHFGGIDQWHGFAERRIWELRNQFRPDSKIPKITNSMERGAVEISGTGSSPYQWYDANVTDAACSFLREQTQSDIPFVLVTGFIMPHCPYFAPADLFKYYLERVALPEGSYESLPETARRFARQHDLDRPFASDTVRAARAAYYSLCEMTDRNTGLILETLEQTGLAENTVVVYTSDHGDMAGDHGLWFKGTFFEGSAGIPLIVRAPGVTTPGTVSKAVCNLTDIGATILDMAGIPPLPQTDGRSLLPLLSGQTASDWRNETFSEIIGQNRKDKSAIPSRMIRSGCWKCWVDGDAANLPPSLFNLDDDPGEQNDLANDSTCADILNQLLGRIFADWNPARTLERYHAALADHALVGDWHNHAAIWKDINQHQIPPHNLDHDVEFFNSVPDNRGHPAQ